MAVTIPNTDFANHRIDLNDSTTFGGASMQVGDTLLTALVVAAGTPTFTCSDTVNGAHTILLHHGDLWVFVFRNSAAGTMTLNLTMSGSGNYSDMMLQLRGVDLVASLLTDTLTNEASTTSHVCATTGLSGTGLFLALSSLASNVNWTPGVNWLTENTTTTTSLILQRTIDTLVSSLGPFTTGTASTAPYAAVVFLPEAATAPPASLLWLPRQQMLRGPRGLMTPSGPVPPTRPEP